MYERWEDYGLNIKKLKLQAKLTILIKKILFFRYSTISEIIFDLKICLNLNLIPASGVLNRKIKFQKD